VNCPPHSNKGDLHAIVLGGQRLSFSCGLVVDSGLLIELGAVLRRVYTQKDQASDYNVVLFLTPEAMRAVVTAEAPWWLRLPILLLHIALRFSCIVHLPNRQLRKVDPKKLIRLCLKLHWVYGGIIDSLDGLAWQTRRNHRNVMVGGALAIAQTGNPSRTENIQIELFWAK